MHERGRTRVTISQLRVAARMMVKEEEEEEEVEEEDSVAILARAAILVHEEVGDLTSSGRSEPAEVNDRFPGLLRSSSVDGNCPLDTSDGRNCPLDTSDGRWLSRVVPASTRGSIRTHHGRHQGRRGGAEQGGCG